MGKGPSKDMPAKSQAALHRPDGIRLMASRPAEVPTELDDQAEKLPPSPPSPGSFERHGPSGDTFSRDVTLDDAFTDCQEFGSASEGSSELTNIVYKNERMDGIRPGTLNLAGLKEFTGTGRASSSKSGSTVDKQVRQDSQSPAYVSPRSESGSSRLGRRKPAGLRLHIDRSEAAQVEEREETLFRQKFSLGEPLNSGTTAVVRRAVRVSDGSEVAVKCVLSQDEEVVKFAQEEYDILKSLDHESVISVEEFYSCSRGSWMIMELCPDGSMQGWVESTGALDEGDARPLLRQLLRGVDYLHGKRIVHRDIKPSNLLFTRSAIRWFLKIADFNSARKIGDDVGSGLMLSFRGTHLYSAPELLFGKLWNERVDIWAVGLSVVFMLTGALPFNCTEKKTKALLFSGMLPDIPWGNTSDVWIHLVLECLAVDMRDRPPAMELLSHVIFCEAPPRIQSVDTALKDMCLLWNTEPPLNSTSEHDVLRRLQHNKYERVYGARTEENSESAFRRLQVSIRRPG